MDKPLCEDCKHALFLSDHNISHRINYDIDRFTRGYFCRRTKYRTSSGGELVTGYDQERFKSCKMERARWFGCGRKGKFFQLANKEPSDG